MLMFYQPLSDLCLLYAGTFSVHIFYWIPQCFGTFSVHIYQGIPQCFGTFSVHIHYGIPQCFGTFCVHIHYGIPQCFGTFSVHIHYGILQCFGTFSLLLSSPKQALSVLTYTGSLPKRHDRAKCGTNKVALMADGEGSF